ncbi:hypothetical protein EZV62_002718 [Acer yangbiense]|uniref:Uncharacterized protein n=1 Tax=Acer yangbiense TaxID=1000413 RepID=A0A5C7IYD1_9ROSI|nr:hypothetical protein EZV62_002718 [Acer yangbiense]
MACSSQLDSMRSPSSPLHRVKLSVLSEMAKRWKGCLKTKECDFYEAKVTCHSHWRTIEMIRSRLSPLQLKTFEEMCFGRFLKVWAFEAIFSLMAKKHAVPTLRFLNPTDEERQQPYFADLLDEDVPLPAELEPDDPYDTAYESDAAGEDNDGGDDGEATQTDETTEVGDGGDVEAQETALVVRKSPHKIRQQSRFATTATFYAKDDQGFKEGECTVRDHPVEIGSDAGSHDPDASVVQLDKQPKGMIKAPRNRKRSADTSSPFTDSTIRKQKK